MNPSGSVLTYCVNDNKVLYIDKAQSRMTSGFIPRYATLMLVSLKFYCKSNISHHFNSQCIKHWVHLQKKSIQNGNQKSSVSCILNALGEEAAQDDDPIAAQQIDLGEDGHELLLPSCSLIKTEHHALKILLNPIDGNILNGFRYQSVINP